MAARNRDRPPDDADGTRLTPVVEWRFGETMRAVGAPLSSMIWETRRFYGTLS